MNKLLKDAIADAKAVRETALAQAKLALEEAFAPKLQSMLSNKIKEEMQDEEPMDDESMRMKELAGLGEAEDEMDADLEGGDDMGDLEDMGDEEGMEDNTFSVNGQEFEVNPVGGDDMEGDMEDMGDDMGDMGGEEDEDLAEILRQLEEEDMNPQDDEVENEFHEGAAQDPNASKEEDDFWKYMNSLEETTPEMKGDYKPEDDEEVNLDELIQALREGEDEDEENANKMDEVAGDEEYKKASDQAMDTAKGSHGNVVEMKKKMKKMEEEINEAYTAVKFLREKLSEVNLLNAKLLYVNKLFRKNGLSENQKIKIIETFDRAKNVREAKLIFATLSESFNSQVKTKKPVVENFASAPVKKTKVIAEGNEQMNRFKQLAGIIKS